MGYSEFDKRMKKYEYVTRTYLTTRTPVIIRIDGKAFHTFTRGFRKPFDENLSEAMQQTMKYLCENIQGLLTLRKPLLAKPFSSPAKKPSKP